MKSFSKVFIPLFLLMVACAATYVFAGHDDKTKLEQQLEHKGRLMKLNPLSPEEERILVHKGTESPYSGEYLNNKDTGLYVCRRCDAPLYQSEDKFDSRSGWPSFDDAIPGAVLRIADADGIRTEIVCSNCGGHLGHVFEGEGFTSKDTRHCVNSISMKFLPEKAAPAVAFFGGGCFWGVEDGFDAVPGVLNAVSGYMGGDNNFPTYEDVTTGETGHAEVVKVEYDPAKVDFETLAKYFFEIHDPTQLNRQGPDFGTQYRSVIFYADEAQRQVAQKLKDYLIDKGLNVVTEISPAPAFFAAEDYHQDFTKRTGRGACHMRVNRFDS